MTNSKKSFLENLYIFAGIAMVANGQVIQKRYLIRTSWMLCVMLCLVLTGCISTKCLERNQYLFDLPKSFGKAVMATPNGCSVFIEHIEAAPPFDQLDFLYRVKSGRYLTDYYHGFASPPAEQLEAILVANLRDKIKFNLYITEQPVAKNRLRVKLTELYADYSIRNNPRAVIALHLILTKYDKDKMVVLFDQVLRANIALKAKNTDNLLDGWNVGIQGIVEQVVRVLNQQIKCWFLF